MARVWSPKPWRVRMLILILTPQLHFPQPHPVLRWRFRHSLSVKVVTYQSSIECLFGSNDTSQSSTGIIQSISIYQHSSQTGNSGYSHCSSTSTHNDWYVKNPHGQSLSRFVFTPYIHSKNSCLLGCSCCCLRALWSSHCCLVCHWLQSSHKP